MNLANHKRSKVKQNATVYFVYSVAIIFSCFFHAFPCLVCVVVWYYQVFFPHPRETTPGDQQLAPVSLAIPCNICTSFYSPG